MMQMRRDTWCCCVAGLFAVDRIVKLAAQKGVSFALGPFEYSAVPLSRIFAFASARESAFIFFPPLMFLFWVFYKCGGIKPRFWSLFVFAGLVSMAADLLLLRGFQYCFSFGAGDGAVVFNLATIYLMLGAVAGIWEMAVQASENSQR